MYYEVPRGFFWKILVDYHNSYQSWSEQTRKDRLHPDDFTLLLHLLYARRSTGQRRALKAADPDLKNAEWPTGRKGSLPRIIQSLEDSLLCGIVPAGASAPERKHRPVMLTMDGLAPKDSNESLVRIPIKLLHDRKNRDVLLQGAYAPVFHYLLLSPNIVLGEPPGVDHVFVRNFIEEGDILAAIKPLGLDKSKLVKNALAQFKQLDVLKLVCSAKGSKKGSKHKIWLHLRGVQDNPGVERVRVEARCEIKEVNGLVRALGEISAFQPQRLIPYCLILQEFGCLSKERSLLRQEVENIKKGRRNLPVINDFRGLVGNDEVPECLTALHKWQGKEKEGEKKNKHILNEFCYWWLARHGIQLVALRPWEFKGNPPTNRSLPEVLSGGICIVFRYSDNLRRKVSEDPAVSKLWCDDKEFRAYHEKAGMSVVAVKAPAFVENRLAFIGFSVEPAFLKGSATIWIAYRKSACNFCRPA